MNALPGEVLITGASGWLGSSLLHALTRGLPDYPDLALANTRRIRVLVPPEERMSELPRSERCEVGIVRGDLRNPADCAALCARAQGSLLFHTAGIIHPRRVSEFYEINVDGTRNLLEAAVQAGVRRAVIVSSNSPCGCNPHPDHLFDELSPYRPYQYYGRSKMRMEQLASGFQEGGRLETVIVRSPWFYGPNQPPRQTLFFRMVRDGKAPIVGNGENLRSMSYVDNLCAGLILAAGTERAAGQTYWIADREPYSMNRILDTIEHLLEDEFGQRCAHKRFRLSGVASKVAFLADYGLQAAGLYHQKIHVLSEMNKTIACSIVKAESELGYRPVVALEEGMRRSLTWCKQNGMLI